MIVFTNTRTEEIDSLSLFSTQIFIQSYYNSLNSNQFYKDYKNGPRGVAVSIGACGGLFLLEKEKARGQQKMQSIFCALKTIKFLTKRKLQRLRRYNVLGELMPAGKINQASPKIEKVPQIALRPSSNALASISSLALGNLGEGPFYSEVKQ